MDFSGLQILWITMAALVFVGWLIASFTQPSPRRVVVEWAAADAMYVGFVSFFVFLTLRAQASGNTVALVAFGFLCVLFGGGLIAALWQTATSLAGGKKTESSATN
jgi:hypothetical protein